MHVDDSSASSFIARCELAVQVAETSEAKPAHPN